MRASGITISTFALILFVLVLIIIVFIVFPLPTESGKVVQLMDVKDAELSGSMETWLRSSPAYQLGINQSGVKVFSHPRKAWNQMKQDLREVIFIIQWKYQAILPLTRWYYEPYLALGWQINEKNNEVNAKGFLLTNFLDIYQMSYQ